MDEWGETMSEVLSDELSHTYLTGHSAEMVFTDPATGVEQHHPIRQVDFTFRPSVELTDVPWFVPMASFGITITTHLTRRTNQAWRKVFGLPSGRREARRRHHKRMRRNHVS